MVRPFVKAPGGGSEDGSGSGSRPGSGSGDNRRGRQGSGGGQGRQQPAGRGRSNGPGQGPGPGPGPGGQGGPGVPGPRPPRDNDPRQVPGLVSNPMPPPRAVARQSPPRQPAPDMSDLTTTMPILAVPADDGYDGYDGHAGYAAEDGYDGSDGYDDRDGYQDYEYENAPPGEYGHYHDDADLGRHRGDRPPRALKIGAILAGVAVVSVAAYSVLGGGSKAPSAGPVAAGASTVGGAADAPGTPSDSSTAGAPAPTGTPSDSKSASSTSSTKASPTHTTKSSPSKPTTSSHSSAPSSSSAPSAPPSSAPSTTPTSVAVPPPSSASPTFTSLGPGSSGAAVSQLQQNLKRWGGYYGWPNLKVTGTWDTATTNAVQAFQDDKGTSPPDPYGVYGPATDQALRKAVG